MTCPVTEREEMLYPPGLQTYIIGSGRLLYEYMYHIEAENERLSPGSAVYIGTAYVEIEEEKESFPMMRLGENQLPFIKMPLLKS